VKMPKFPKWVRACAILAAIDMVNDMPELSFGNLEVFTARLVLTSLALLMAYMAIND